MKSFEIRELIKLKEELDRWTVNLKSFEIIYTNQSNKSTANMNCKLEKFWNYLYPLNYFNSQHMNCKLEKFWNKLKSELYTRYTTWTVNLKSFEIEDTGAYQTININEL